MKSLEMEYDERYQQMQESYHEATELTEALVADDGQKNYKIVDQKKKNIDNTLVYYNQNSLNFICATQSVDFHEIQELFLSYLPKESKILDLGCGSGRDAKYFVNHGCDVVAVDGSEEICKAASKYIGICVKQMLFQDLNEKNTYDGIWACASVLHLSKIELPDMFQRMRGALKQDGILYTSFKYGTFEGMRNGRYFTNFTEQSFCEVLGKIKGLKIEKMWLTKDVRENRGNEQWLNIILRRVDIN